VRKPHFEPEPFHPNRPGLVAPVPLDPTGRAGPTRGQAKGGHWRRTSQGLYVPSSVDADCVEQRIVEAAAVLPETSGVTGWAGLRWMRGHWFDGLAEGGRRVRPVWLATGVSDVRRQSGIEPSAERLNPLELMTVDAVAVTIPQRSLCFEMRYAPTLRLAVVAIDMAAYSNLVSIWEMVLYVVGYSGSTGIPQCREAIALADENSWSPMETLMRLVWTIDAGLPRPLCNVPVFDLHGCHVGTPDLFDPQAGVVGEYDGSLHLRGAQRARDVRREEAFRSLGLEYVTMLAADASNPADFVHRLHSTYGRAKWLSPAERSWTLELPEWWIPTATVAQRRALDDHQRARLLRRRAG
jgi:hypothetical protein